MVEDFKNLVTWVHSHAKICPHIPYQAEGYRLEDMNTFVHPWNCAVGHAYNWPLLSLSTRVEDSEKILKETEERERYLHQTEKEELGIAVGLGDLCVSREEGLAESDDSQSSLVTHLSRVQGDDVGEQREASTPKQAKVTTPKQKKKVPYGTAWGLQEQAFIPTSTASPTEKSDGPWGARQPKIPKLDKSTIQEKGGFAEDNTATAAVLDDRQSSMQLGDLGSDTDSAAEDELMNKSQSGAGDAASTTPSWSQGRSRSQTEGLPSPAAPRSLYAGFSAPTASGTTEDTSSNRKVTPVRKKPKGILGGLRNVLNFQAWLESTSPSPSTSRSLGCLSLAELDALMVSYLKYMWEGGNRQLTQSTLVCHARCLDRHLRVQGCFYSVLKSPELPETRQLLEGYCQELRERETDQHAKVICSVTAAEEGELRRLGVLGRGSPEALLHLVLFNNLRAFGPTHLYRMWPVPAGKFHTLQVPASPQPGVAKPMLECLEWVDPTDPDHTPLRMLARPDDPLHCPLQDFREYGAKHVDGILNQHDAVYSNRRTGVDLQSHEWYTRSPMSKYRLDKMVKALAKRIEAIRVTHTMAPV